MKPYPIFLMDLANRHCIVIGGGHEGEGKVRGLLDCDATVTVISPRLTPTLQSWAEEGRFTWLDRAYAAGDLRGAFLVIAERADAEINERIWQEAETEGALINVMDDVTHCNFVAGSVVRQGPLTISISTSGAAPTLAVRLRERMQQEFGPEYGLFLEWMQALRAPMADRYPKFMERRARWYAVVDSDVLALLRAGNREAALERIHDITGIDVEVSAPAASETAGILEPV
ncbi:MAG: bifunctional precorrin-2 dehydrogenase/sirohydrochlorin ferrochelatase [Caldilineaceae bacterium]